MMPRGENPEDWFQMDLRDLSRDEAIYLEICSDCGLSPNRSDLEAIREAERDRMLTATAAALGVLRAEAEQLAAQRRIHWRRSDHLQIQTRQDGGHWASMTLPALQFHQHQAT